MKWILCFMALPFVCASPGLAAGAAQPGNLVSNPGFEEGMAPWEGNDWLKNEVRFERVEDNPHSGNRCFHMDFTKAVGGSVTQFIYPGLQVRPGQTIRLSYWARGVSNGPPLHINLRLGKAPWTVWFHAASVPTENWQEFVYNITLPSGMDSSAVQLIFQMRELGQVWVDDVSITELPAVEEGVPPVENPIRNASFEAGRDGWTATFRIRDFGTLREESGSNSPSPDNARLDVPEDRGSPQGRSHLSFTVDPGCRAELTSAYFPARYGHSMLLKFYLKSDTAGEFEAGVASGKNANTRWDGKTTLKASGQWQAFSVPITLKPATGGLYCASFVFNEPGHYELDAVSLTEVEHPNVELFPPAVAMEAPAGAPVGHLYGKDEEARFQVRVAGIKGEKNFPCEVKISDYMGEEIGRAKGDVELDDEGYGTVSFRVPTDRYGAFLMELRRGKEPSAGASWWKKWFGGEKEASAKLPEVGPPLAEQIYSVLPALPAPADRPDSFFGAHVDFSPYNLEIARKAGYRWLRLYPPLVTQWMAVEHSPGNWKFRTSEVARAKKEGFRILANLGTAPDFAADLPEKPEPTRWTRSYPPADLNRWKDYITRCFNAFYPHVDAWEVWNEPDGGYLKVGPGQEKSDVYVPLLRAAREALDATGKPVFLIGPALAQINAPLGWEILEKGGGKYLDAFSFHFYSLAAGGGNPDTDFVAPLLVKYATYKNREGKPLPLWHSEGGIYLQGSQSWLQTYRIPPSSTVTPSEAAASVVRSTLFFKASGVRRYFDFMVDASEAGRRVHEDITCGFIDVTGIPGPGIAAHAAMVSLVEDAEPAGFESRQSGGTTVKIAHFKKPGETVDAIWAVKPIGLSEVMSPDTIVEVKDLMGNPVPFQEARLGEFPVYVVRKNSP